MIFNALIIPFVLYYGYGIGEAFGVTGTLPVLGIHALTVAAGEAVVCYLIGIQVMFAAHVLDKKTGLFRE